MACSPSADVALSDSTGAISGNYNICVYKSAYAIYLIYHKLSVAFFGLAAGAQLTVWRLHEDVNFSRQTLTTKLLEHVSCALKQSYTICAKKELVWGGLPDRCSRVERGLQKGLQGDVSFSVR